MKRLMGSMLLLLFLTACAPAEKTVVEDEAMFSGEGKEWKVRYIYNAEQYDAKKVNWIKVESKDRDVSKMDLSSMDIELKSRDGVITGGVGGMKTEVDGNTISFLVGTVNDVTYEEDEYTITITYQKKAEVVKLRQQ